MTDEAKKILIWRAHPAKERVLRTVGASLVILLFGLLIFAGFQSPASGGLSVIVLVLALNRYFFPSRFEIDEEGITARYPLRRMRLLWKDLRRFVHDHHGGYLSTRSVASRLDAYQGMHILFDGHREQVVKRINQLLAAGHPGCSGHPGAGGQA